MTGGLGVSAPAYGRNELERAIFNSEVRAAQSLLARWQQKDDGLAIAFVPKKVRGGCLASLAASLCAVGEAFKTLRITVIKYWYDPKFSSHVLGTDARRGQFHAARARTACRRRATLSLENAAASILGNSMEGQMASCAGAACLEEPHPWTQTPGIQLLPA
jgi:hypothetical protein